MLTFIDSDYGLTGDWKNIQNFNLTKETKTHQEFMKQFDRTKFIPSNVLRTSLIRFAHSWIHFFFKSVESKIINSQFK